MASPTPAYRPPIRTLAFILLGPIFWAIQLLVIYGSQSSLCAFTNTSWPGNFPLLHVILIGVTTLMAATNAALAAHPGPAFILMVRRRPDADLDQFILVAARLLAGLSLLAVLYAGMTIFSLPQCAVLR